MRAGRFELLLSALVLTELEMAPEEVRSHFYQLTAGAEAVSPITEEMRSLAESHIQNVVLPPKCYNDAVHIAGATVLGADVLVSWNFRHRVNFGRIEGYRRVNEAFGYPSPNIMSPLELIAYEKQED